ncbi:DUF1874 domain-containing protein [Candidatus Aerophobetes bacterium]|nr:DUF1874 domain-containing protein [Candidatus Aerophobetes bacterium]
MAKVFLTTTFSPSMMGRKAKVLMVHEVKEEEFWRSLSGVKNVEGNEFIPAIGHENTADIVRKRMPKEMREQKLFNRVNIEVEHGDWIFAIIPQVRFNSTREFTDEEVKKAEFRFFIIL